MEWIKIAIQVVIAVSIFNVWLIRFGKPPAGEAALQKV